MSKKLSLTFLKSLFILGVSSTFIIPLTSCTTVKTYTEEDYDFVINWNDDNEVAKLETDEQGIIYESSLRETIIAISPKSVNDEIVIPKTVKKITGYKKIVNEGTNTDPKLTYISTGAFESNYFFSKVTFEEDSLLESIGMHSFSKCIVLEKIDLSNCHKLEMIKTSAFNGCASLTDVVLPDNENTSISLIGNLAFANCYVLENVAPLNQIGFVAPKTIGEYLYTYLDKSQVTYSGIGTQAFSGTSITTIDLSNIVSITPLANGSFKEMEELSSVIWGEECSIKSIPLSTFEGTTNLKTLVLPKSIQRIYSTNLNYPNYNTNSPFYNSGLTTIDMTNITSYWTENSTIAGTVFLGKSSLPYYIFNSCTNLETVLLKTGTTAIDAGAFYGCTNLKTVKEGSMPTSSSGEGFVISSTIEAINTKAFTESGISTVSFSNTKEANALWFIGVDAFKDCTNLTSIDLTYAANTGAHSFDKYYVNNASNNQVVEGIGFICVPSGMVSGSSKLTTIKLPTTVTLINESAFIDTPELQSVNFNELINLQMIEADNFNNTKISSLDFSKLTTTASESLKKCFTEVINIFTGLQSSVTVNFPNSWKPSDDGQFPFNEKSFLTSNTTDTSSTNHPTVTYS